MRLIYDQCLAIYIRDMWGELIQPRVRDEVTATQVQAGQLLQTGNVHKAGVCDLFTATHVQAGELRETGKLLQPRVRDVDTLSQEQAGELREFGNVLQPRVRDLATARQVHNEEHVTITVCHVRQHVVGDGGVICIELTVVLRKPHCQLIGLYVLIVKFDHFGTGVQVRKIITSFLPFVCHVIESITASASAAISIGRHDVYARARYAYICGLLVVSRIKATARLLYA